MDPVTLLGDSKLAKAVTDTLAGQGNTVSFTDQQLINQFTQLMQTGQTQLDKVESLVSVDSSALNNPGALLQANNLDLSAFKALSGQTLLTGMTAATDVAAKLAGYFSQAINKLVSMQ